ncbi:MAG: zinc ribbon domain-containing protein [Mycobacterium sp.]|nr:zinc ribbon domain-containing protein [Mycobacterium sp.]
MYHCEHCGLEIDRDRNAAINLARHALRATEPSTGVVAGGADRKTEPSGTAGGSETGTVSQPRARPKARKDGLPEMPVIQTLTFQVTVFHPSWR